MHRYRFVLFRPLQFLPVLFGFFIVCLFVFYGLFHSDVSGRGMAFFLWVTVFNVFSVSVFWSFMADVFATEEARKYYGYIGAAGTLGGSSPSGRGGRRYTCGRRARSAWPGVRGWASPPAAVVAIGHGGIVRVGRLVGGTDVSRLTAAGPDAAA